MKMLYLTNIPTPYRNKRFNTMVSIFKEYGIDFEVLYMKERFSDTVSWCIPSDSFNYNYKLYDSYSPKLYGIIWSFCPSLLLRLKNNDFDLIVIGGLDCPNMWLAPFFTNRKAIKILSSESVLQSVKRKKGIGYFIKNKLISMYDYFQVTGKRQKEYIDYFSNSKHNKSYVMLPNIIDEDIYVKQCDIIKNNSREFIRNKHNVSDSQQIWFISARLIPVKGLHLFLPLLTNIMNVKIIIAGDGEDFKRLSNIVTDLNLNVDFLGFVQQQYLIKYYAGSDLFILPSIADNSPLAAIEAIAAGLPVLFSDRIGNYDDVLEDGFNGFGFDPFADCDSNKKIISKLSSLSFNELQIMGNNSRSLYERRFSTTECLKKYAQSILTIFNESH